MPEKYFLTPQTANLMEDLYREISSRSSLFLLYSVQGIGKSSLVHQFLQNREFRSAAVRLDFTPANNSVPDATTINQAFENCQDADFIVIDHLEEAGQKARHQIFQSWMTDGIDKRLNVLLITTSDCLPDFSLLSNQYKASIQCFQLLPFSKLEIDSYISLRLMPQNRVGDLTLELTSEARKALKKLEGKPSELDLFCKNYSDQITIRSIKTVPDNRKTKSIFVIILALVLSGLAIWFLGGQSGQKLYPPLFELFESKVDMDLTELNEETRKESTEPSDKIIIEAKEINPEAPEIQPVESRDKENQTDLGTKGGVEEQPAPVDEKQKDDEISQSSVTIEKSSSIAGSQADAVRELSPDNQQSIDDVEVSTWFEQQLTSSMDWINSSSHKKATIQIMSIGFDRFDNDAYKAYVKNLTDKGVVESNIRVFQTYANGASVFSVIYGQFEDRKAAYRAIGELPQSLKANQPIPRTIGGIWREIQQNKE